MYADKFGSPELKEAESLYTRLLKRRDDVSTGEINKLVDPTVPESGRPRYGELTQQLRQYGLDSLGLRLYELGKSVNQNEPISMPRRGPDIGT